MILNKFKKASLIVFFALNSSVCSVCGFATQKTHAGALAGQKVSAV
jgi:hypothetical protein